MHEDILAILALDKAESLPGVEPLYCTCFSHLSSLLFYFLTVSRLLAYRLRMIAAEVTTDALDHIQRIQTT